jgi:hypothetical protein
MTSSLAKHWRSTTTAALTPKTAVAFGHNIQTQSFTRKNGSRLNTVVRVTDVYRKLRGKWLIVQEHESFPVDAETGRADLMSRPQLSGILVQ